MNLQASFRDSSKVCAVLQAVTKLVAASGGSHFAASLVSGHVAMAAQTAKGTSGTEWLLAGCSRQLPSAVAGIAFGEAPTGQTRFFSLGVLALLAITKRFFC